MTLNPITLASLALIGFWLIEIFLRKGSSARSWRTTQSDRGSTFAIVATYILVGIAFTIGFRGPRLPLSVRWIGSCAAIVGIALRVVAFGTLGSSYSRTLRVNADQQLITHGIYRWVRHPGYASAILAWLGAAAASGSLLVFALVGLLLIGVYVYRIRAEEEMLMQTFGFEYQQYQAHSWRLVPYVY